MANTEACQLARRRIKFVVKVNLLQSRNLVENMEDTIQAPGHSPSRDFTDVSVETGAGFYYPITNGYREERPETGGARTIFQRCVRSSVFSIYIIT